MPEDTQLLGNKAGLESIARVRGGREERSALHRGGKSRAGGGQGWEGGRSTSPAGATAAPGTRGRAGWVATKRSAKEDFEAPHIRSVLL